MAEIPFCYAENESYLCDDNNTYNGYWWFGAWVPGMVSMDTWFTQSPNLVYGYSTFYGPYAMKATADYRGMKNQERYVGMVSGMFCADIGNQVWIKRYGQEWEGPFLVVDCARQNDLYGIIVYRKEVVEVDYRTAIKWGMVSSNGEILKWRTPVIVSKIPSNSSYAIIELKQWFLNMVKYSDHNERNYVIMYKYPSTWRIGGKWITFPNNLYEHIVRKPNLLMYIQ